MSNNKLAVLDFGTSKIKILTCEKNLSNEILYNLQFEIVSIGKLLKEDIDNNSKNDILSDFIKKTTINVDKLKNDGYFIKAIATEIFRRNKDLNTTLIELSNKLNFELEILDERKEAILLSNNFNLNNDTLLTDIGGGSSQLIYSDNNEITTKSFPIGSYKLYSIFQPNNEIFTDDIYLKISDYVTKTVQINKKFNNLIVGSNLMLDFFNSLSKVSGLNFIKNDCFDSGIVSNLINNLFLNQKYEDLFKYFPQNTNFMYGADKMLVILENYIKIFDIKTVYPTNKGITTGVAKSYFCK